MKIAHLIYCMRTGGAETMLVDLVNKQSEAGHDVHLIILNNKEDSDLTAKITSDVKIHRMGRPESSHNPWYVLKMNALILRLKPQILHLHSSDIGRWVFVPHKHVYLTAHSLNYVVRSQNKPHVIAISQAVYDDITSRHPHLEATMIHNGLYTHDIKVRRNVAEPVDGKTWQVVQVGNLNYHNKGQDIAISAVARVIGAGHKNVRLTLIGEDRGTGQYLQSLANDLGMGNRLVMTGMQDREYIHRTLGDYDIMFHPCRFEGFGLVVAEAMIAGVPVLVPDSKGPCEVCCGETYGNTFGYADIEAAAARLQQMIEDYATAIDKAEEAAKYAVETYSIEAMAQKYLALYESGLASKS